MTLIVRAAKANDTADILNIEKECFGDEHWATEDFLANECTVAELGGQIVGFLVSRETFAGTASELPEREILNLGVPPDFRRQGIARRLLETELGHRATFFLEVRESNAAAQRLYRAFGFKEIARRKDYYQHPTESAIVMQMK